MASPTLSPPPLSSPLATKDGAASPTWSRWLQQLQALLTGGTNWVTPTLTGGWVNVGAGNASAQYRKDAEGRVTIRGLIKSGSLSSAAFTLPAGFRPSGNETFACSANGAFGNFAVTSAGVVLPQVGSTTNFSLECSFWADG